MLGGTCIELYFHTKKAIFDMAHCSECFCSAYKTSPPPPAMIMRPKINKRISYKRPALLLSAEKLDQLLADLSNSHSNGKEYRGFVGIWPVQLLMLHTGASKCLWTFLVLLSCSTFDPGWLIVLHFNLRYCKQPHICVHQSLMGFIADPIHGRIYCNCKVCG